MRNTLDDTFLRILQKCASSPCQVDSMLNESSIRYLVVEALDEKDINEITKKLNATAKVLDSLEKYTDELQMKAELQPMYDYIAALSSALDKAAGELANASFEPGGLSGFFGKKVSLPALVAASVKLNTKAVDFGRGFLSAMTKIRGQLAPLLKDADKSATLRSAVEDNDKLDTDKIEKGLESALVDALGGSLFKKVGDFFGKARFGTEADIMSSPGLDVDLKALATDIATQLFDAKLENLLGEAPPPVPDESLVTDLADEMEDSAEAAEEAEEKADDPEAAEGTEGTEDAEDAEAAEEEAPAGAHALSRNDLKAIKAAMDKAKSAKKSQTKALGGALNKMLGKDVFAEQKVYDLRTILISGRRQDNSSFSRWQRIAGITDE